MRGSIRCHVRLSRLFVVLMLGLNIIEEIGDLYIIKVEEFCVECHKAIDYLLFLLH